MKFRRLISVMLAVILACSVLPLDTLAANVPSDWFVAEMNDANGKGLLTARAAKDFQRAMSRDEFCELAVLMTEYTLGKELPLPASNPFLDCNSEYVQKAYLYGMVNGIDTTHFGPDRPIERQQLVALMIRALTQTQTDLGKTLLAPPVPALPFNDSGKVSDYARTPLMYAYANNIVKGDDQNNFNPATNVTSQECVAVIIRSFNKTQDVINAALAQSSLIVKAADLLKIGYAYGDTAAGVSQNVLLPTAGLGGATVAWTSSNSSVISAAGVVNAAYSLPVMLTATVRLGSYTQTRTFNLQTTAYSGDKLIVENGYSELDVSFYNAGDSVDSVTGRIFLPSHSVSAAVTWASSNPSVVDTNGKVVLPANATIQTVALTATITSGAQSRTKTFNLKIRNPLYSVNAVALHGVTLGMTQAQVTALLGAAKGTMTTATSETWSVYYTDSYVGFIAVALQANKVVGVYSMAADWANQLRDSVTKQVVTAAQINEQSNVSATVYTDAGNANKQYAVFVADKTSTILRLRTQTAAGVEALTLAIMNAFRVQNSRAAFDADARLASSARSHSTDMGVYNYFTETGRTGSSTFITRAVAAGYDATAAASVTGAIIGGGVNAFDFLNDVVSNATNRARLIDTAKNVSGLGYYYATSASSYGSYCTVVFGVGTYLSNVTPVAALTVNGSAQGTTTLTLTPSSRSETVTVTSSGTGYLTLLSGNNGTAVSSLTIPAASPTFPLYFKGVAPTSAAYPVYINVKGDVSGKLFQIPVTVVAVNATSLAVKHNETVSSAAVGTPATASAPAIAADGSAVIILGVGNDFQLAATTAPAAGPVVTWSSAYPARATVNSAGKITGVAVGTTTITATVPRSGGVLTVSVYVYVVSMPLTTNGVPFTNNSPEIAAGTAVPVSASAVVGLPTGALTNPTGYTWTPTSTSGYAYVSNTNTSGNTITAKTAGTVMMSVSVTLSNSSGSYKHVGKISSAVSVKVVGTKPYPDRASASPDAITMAYGEEQQLTINLTPAAVNKIIVWEYDHSAVSITPNPSDPCKFTVKGLKVGAVTAIARVQISESASTTDAVSVLITVTKIKLGISVSANTPSKEISIAAPGTYKCDFVMTPSQVGALSLGGYSVTWRGGTTLGTPGITINPATGIISIDRATAVAGGMATFYADVTISDAGLYGNTSFSSTAVDLRIVP